MTPNPRVLFRKLIASALKQGATRETVALLAVDVDSQVGKEVLQALREEIPRGKHNFTCSCPREVAEKIAEVFHARRVRVTFKGDIAESIPLLWVDATGLDVEAFEPIAPIRQGRA